MFALFLLLFLYLLNICKLSESDRLCDLVLMYIGFKMCVIDVVNDEKNM